LKAKEGALKELGADEFALRGDGLTQEKGNISERWKNHWGGDQKNSSKERISTAGERRFAKGNLF